MDKLKQKWQMLNSREQWLVKIVTVFIGLLLLYYGIIVPLNNAAIQAKNHYVYQQDLLTWMAPRVKVLEGSSQGATQQQPVTQAELLPTIDTRLKETEFAKTVEQVTQANSNNVRVTFKNVPFDALMNWLVTQWHASRITVNAIDVQKGDKLGLTTINLTLSLAS